MQISDAYPVSADQFGNYDPGEPHYQGLRISSKYLEMQDGFRLSTYHANDNHEQCEAVKHPGSGRLSAWISDGWCLCNPAQPHLPVCVYTGVYFRSK